MTSLSDPIIGIVTNWMIKKIRFADLDNQVLGNYWAMVITQYLTTDYYRNECCHSSNRVCMHVERHSLFLSYLIPLRPLEYLCVKRPWYKQQVYNQKRGWSLYITQKMVTLLNLFHQSPLFPVKISGLTSCLITTFWAVGILCEEYLRRSTYLQTNDDNNEKQLFPKTRSCSGDPVIISR